MTATNAAYNPADAEALDRGWQADAACKGMDAEWFFTERGQSTAPAKAVCAGCPVREACLAYALAAGEKWGIWGMTSERERKRMRAALRRGAAA